MNNDLSITTTSIFGRPPRSVLLLNKPSSFGLKPSQFILFPISTNLSPNSLIRSYSWRMAKSVRLLIIYCILLIVFIFCYECRFFGILPSHFDSPSFFSSYPEGDYISRLLELDDLMAHSLCPAGYVFLCGRIVSFHLQNLADLDILNLLFGP